MDYIELEPCALIRLEVHLESHQSTLILSIHDAMVAQLPQQLSCSLEVYQNACTDGILAKG